jgi:hypothetical protein
MSFTQSSYVMVNAGLYGSAAPQEFAYKSADALATQEGSAYFNNALPLPNIGDLMYLYDSGAADSAFVRVTAVSPNVTVIHKY